MKFIIITKKKWDSNNFKKLSKNILVLNNINSLKIKRINPKIIFFIHWSKFISQNIFKKYLCIQFHASNLPKGKGGSPIQNQIIRNIKNTKSTAFIMNNGIDTGDILLQKTLSLEGNISDIVDRITQNNYDLITKIIQGKFIQKKQSGKSTVFKRRQPFESELKSLNHPNQYIYNFIRMLQDPYPNAFLKIDGHKIIFKSAKIKGKNIHFEGVIE